MPPTLKNDNWTNSPIAVATGEPAGIGPDIALLAALRCPAIPLVLVGDADLLAKRAQALNLSVTLKPFQKGLSLLPGEIAVMSVSLKAPCVAGTLSASNAPYVLATLQTALAGCQAGTFAALVTCPVHKAVMQEASIAFLGHTEYLARCLNVADPVMLFVAQNLKMALVTTHLPLRQVPDAVTPKRLTATIRVLDHGLKTEFGLSRPHLLVAGLNPHAGESGTLGSEEMDVIAPVLAALQATGIRVEGPFSADTIYHAYQARGADAMVMMYHDQGLPLLKGIAFGQSVNMTLGLPIIRTSVDHGTALSLAGTGQAKADSLIAAIQLAHQLSQQRFGRKLT